MSKLPVVFLAFANESASEGTHLRALGSEANAISDIFETAEANKLCELIQRFNVTQAQIFDTFRRYQERIVIFHYGGHANSWQLLVNTQEGTGMESLYMKSLVDFLGEQQGLKLVFLNGCSSLQQAEALFEKGISAVGTTGSINDQTARLIAEQFYKNLATSTIGLKQAWRFSKNELEAKVGTANYRTLLWPDQATEQPVQPDDLWIALFQPHHEFWKLQQGREKHSKGKYHTNPPLCPELFIGREKQLTKIYQHFFGTKQDFLLLMNGRGGIGKTTLAAQYWYSHEKDYKHLFWLFVEDDLANSLLLLAPGFGMKLDEKLPKEAQLNIVIGKLRELDGPCLMILDNANTASALEDAYRLLYPNSNKKGKVY